jgi:hypothetical protein
MRTIVAGSRNTQMAVHKVFKAIEHCGFPVTEIVSGSGGNVDHAGEYVAGVKHLPCHRFPAYWTKYGKSAGPRRNREMAEFADALIVIWDGKSKGTKNMIAEAQKRGLRIHVEGDNGN